MRSVNQRKEHEAKSLIELGSEVMSHPTVELSPQGLEEGVRRG